MRFNTEYIEKACKINNDTYDFKITCVQMSYRCDDYVRLQKCSVLSTELYININSIPIRRWLKFIYIDQTLKSGRRDYHLLNKVCIKQTTTVSTVFYLLWERMLMFSNEYADIHFVYGFCDADLDLEI